MKSLKYLFPLVFLFPHCSVLQFDADHNCLNSKASCFITDNDPPTIADSIPAAGANNVQQLSDIQSVTFSEPVNGAEKPSSYVFSGAGGSAIVVSSVTKVDDKTYLLGPTGALNNGPVVLSFSGVTDWAGNAAVATLTFTANVSIVLTATSTPTYAGNYYVSGGGGTASLSVTWQSDTADTAPNVQYFVNIEPSTTPCPTSVTGPNSTGTGNTGNITVTGSTITSQIKAADMAAAGAYTACVFVNKTSAPLKTGSVSFPFIRDDTKPVISSVAPASSVPVNNTQVSYALTEDCNTATITWTRTTGTADAASPHAQTLTTTEAAAGAHAAITLNNNPALVSGAIYSIAFNCNDYAGNAATTITQTNVTYDTTAPLISAVAPATNATINNANVSYTLSKAVVAGAATAITWTQTGGAADASSPHIQQLAGVELSSGAHSNITLANTPTLVNGAIYTVSFDAKDSAGNAATTVASTNVMFAMDSTPPTPGASGVMTFTQGTKTSVTMIWTKATDNSDPQASLQYLMYYSSANNIATVATAESNGTPVGAYAADIAFANATGLTSGATYYFNIIVRDTSGNKAAYAATAQTVPTWTPQIPPGSLDTWLSIVYAAGTFVTGAYTNNKGATSPDGITWTNGTLPASNTFSMTYGAGTFVALNGGTAATSPDGISWTAQTIPTSSCNWNSVTFGAIFVAVGYTCNTAATSPDGITWTLRTLPSSSNWYVTAYSGTTYVAVGNNVAATSPDGITWTARTITSGNWQGLTYGGGKFVAVPVASATAATSPDGITWSPQTLPILGSWTSIAYGGGIFAAVGIGAAAAATSSDGITWIQQTMPINNSWNSVTYGAGKFVAVGTNAAATFP